MKLAAAIFALIASADTSVFAAETRLSIEGPSGALQGTLAAPDTGPKAPVAIIIPGSGPTDRDGNNPLGVTAGSYRLLAEALAAKGVSTIRIDKRGMFGSSAAAADADNLRMSDLADDVRVWGREAQKRTSSRCAWLIGHSEGSLVALIAAQQPDNICGLILVAGAGRKMGDILREQLNANPANAPILAQALAAITELEAGRHVDVSGMHPALAPLFRPSVQGFLIDQMSFDPAQLLARYTGPVLVLQGTTDLQISMLDAQRLAGARSGVTMVTLEGVNHVLKIAPADPPLILRPTETQRYRLRRASSRRLRRSWPGILSVRRAQDSQLVIAGHSASKTRVNALMSRPSTSCLPQVKERRGCPAQGRA